MGPRKNNLFYIKKILFNICNFGNPRGQDKFLQKDNIKRYLSKLKPYTIRIKMTLQSFVNKSLNMTTICLGYVMHF